RPAASAGDRGPGGAPGRTARQRCEPGRRDRVPPRPEAPPRAGARPPGGRAAAADVPRLRGHAAARAEARADRPAGRQPRRDREHRVPGDRVWADASVRAAPQRNGGLHGRPHARSGGRVLPHVLPASRRARPRGGGRDARRSMRARGGAVRGVGGRGGRGGLGRIRDEAVPEDELAKAKAYITLGLPGDFETTAGAASRFRELLVYGLPSDYFEHYAERINAVTAADVQRVARQYIDPEHFDIVVVGDKAQIEAGI